MAKNNVINPWTHLLKKDGIIADCDNTFFNRIGVSPQQYAKGKVKIGLTFDCLPDPYNGNPDSKVYCLCKNPGMPDNCFIGEKAFEGATIDNLWLYLNGYKQP